MVCHTVFTGHPRLSTICLTAPTQCVKARLRWCVMLARPSISSMAESAHGY